MTLLNGDRFNVARKNLRHDEFQRSVHGSYGVRWHRRGDPDEARLQLRSSCAPCSQLNADSVKGIDFTGSSYATITGTVVKADGDGLEGVTVTATSGTKSDSDDTDRRGRFSVSVPAGAITITATKTGYTFASRTVFADAGDTRSLGDITATGNVTPVNVAKPIA